MALPPLSTFVIGPALGARRSEILAQSHPQPELLPVERQRMLEVPLILAGWMAAGEPEMFACIPLSTDPEAPRLLVRAGYIGVLNGEPLGFANAVLADRAAVSALDGHVERLLPLLPPPDQTTTFAAMPLSVGEADLAPLGEGVPTGIEWQDCAVMIADGSPVLDVVRAVLAGAGHPPQHRRLMGWSTSAAVPAHGTFAPDAAFQLIVVAGRPPASDGRRLLTWRGNAIAEPALAAPPAWQSWHDLRQLIQEDPALAPLVPRSMWAIALSDVRPDRLPFQLLLRAIAVRPDGIDLSVKLIEHLRQRGALGSLTAELLGWFGTEPDKRGELLSKLLQLDLLGGARYGIEPILLANPDWVSELDDAAFDDLLRYGTWLASVEFDPDLGAGLGEVRSLKIFGACGALLSQPIDGAWRENCTSILSQCFYYLMARGAEASLRRKEFADGLSAFLTLDPLPPVPPQLLERLVEVTWAAHPQLSTMVAKSLLHIPVEPAHDRMESMVIRACCQYVHAGLEQGERRVLH